MRELRKEPNCEMSKDESRRLSHKEEANRRIPKSDKEPGNIYSVKGSECIWGWSGPTHKEEDKEDWSGQCG